eukprot:m.45085 g.45085  ORF g.45085 m.45085 type:complete len:228 (-) comp10185_c0_seq2:193-876(-)
MATPTRNTSNVMWKAGEEYPVVLGETFSNNCSTQYHSVRYDFKPASIDTSTPGNLNVTAGTQKVKLQLNSTEGGEKIKFEGPASHATKECILLFDSDKKAFRLEKLCKSIKLKHTGRRDDRRTAAKRSADDIGSGESNTLKKKHGANSSLGTTPATDDSTPKSARVSQGASESINNDTSKVSMSSEQAVAKVEPEDYDVSDSDSSSGSESSSSSSSDEEKEGEKDGK